MSHLFQILKSQRVGQAQGRRAQTGTLPEGRGGCGDGWGQARTAVRAGCKLSIPKSCDIDPNRVWPWPAGNRVLPIGSSALEAMAPDVLDACWTSCPRPRCRRVFHHHRLGVRPDSCCFQYACSALTWWESNTLTKSKSPIKQSPSYPENDLISSPFPFPQPQNTSK